jgi:hypothetical protein
VIATAAPPAFAGEPQDSVIVPRASWNVGFGILLGSSWLATDDEQAGGSLSFDIHASVARGITEQTLVGATVERRSAFFPGTTSSDILLDIYTLSVTHFPFERAGLFLSLGGGYARSETFSFTQSWGDTREEQTIDGYMLTGELGYEWRIGSTFGLGVHYHSEYLRFNGAIDDMWTSVAGFRFRWYL